MRKTNGIPIIIKSISVIAKGKVKRIQVLTGVFSSVKKSTPKAIHLSHISSLDILLSSGNVSLNFGM
jgi:hypothetical protein